MMLRRLLTPLSLVLMTSAAQAQDEESAAMPLYVKEWQVSVRPWLGAAVPTSKLETTLAYGVEMGYMVPNSRDKLLPILGVSQMSPSVESNGSDARVNFDFNDKVEVTVRQILLMQTYRFSVEGEERLIPYVGIGPALHTVTSKVTSSAAPGANTETDTHAAAVLAGGVEYRLGRGYWGADVQLSASRLDHKWTGKSNAGAVTIGSGYRFVF